MNIFQRWWAAILAWIRLVFGYPAWEPVKPPPIWVAQAKHGRGRKRGTRSRWDYRR